MDLCYNYFLLSCSRENCALNFWVNEPPTLLRTGIVCYLLSALLLQGELYLEAGVPPHHEDQAGVDLLQVALIAPCHSDHLPEESHWSQDIPIICLNDHIDLTSSGSSAWRIILIKLGTVARVTPRHPYHLDHLRWGSHWSLHLECFTPTLFWSRLIESSEGNLSWSDSIRTNSLNQFDLKIFT